MMADTTVAADDDLPDVLGVLFAQIAGDEDGDAHCKLGHYKGHEVEHLTAGGDSGRPEVVPKRPTTSRSTAP